MIKLKLICFIPELVHEELTVFKAVKRENAITLLPDVAPPYPIDIVPLLIHTDVFVALDEDALFGMVKLVVVELDVPLITPITNMVLPIILYLISLSV